jgi:uncharacterized protein
MSARIESFDFKSVVCDSDKYLMNLEKHGVDLYEAALIFGSPVLTKVDDRQDYGEVRYVSIGMADGDGFVTVHTMRDGDLRMISAWKAGSRDRERYRAALAR